MPPMAATDIDTPDLLSPLHGVRLGRMERLVLLHAPSFADTEQKIARRVASQREIDEVIERSELSLEELAASGMRTDGGSPSPQFDLAGYSKAGELMALVGATSKSQSVSLLRAARQLDRLGLVERYILRRCIGVRRTALGDEVVRVHGDALRSGSRIRWNAA